MLCVGAVELVAAAQARVGGKVGKARRVCAAAGANERASGDAMREGRKVCEDGGREKPEAPVAFRELSLRRAAAACDSLQWRRRRGE